jgi:hypothetical protein
MIYVYAITDPLEPPEEIRGLHDAPLETAIAGNASAVYSTHEQLEVNPDPALLWRHDQVVERLLELGGVLPLRFGTVFERGDELNSVLEREGPRFERLLEQVRGCVELSVRVGIAPAAEPDATNGTAYMRSKLAARREREGAAERVLLPLRELAKASSRRSAGGNDALLNESYLVRREALEPFIAEVSALQSRNDDVSVSCTGPWGPYSFVGGDET